MIQKHSEKISPESLIYIGQLGAPHGVRGELRLFSLSDVPERFQTLKHVWWIGSKKIPERLTLAGFRPGIRFHLVRFSEVNTAEEAGRLTNGYVAVAQDERAKLPRGSFYVDDVIGMEARDEHQRPIGQVIEVIQTGSNDVYVIRQANQQEVLIPALKEYVLEINPEAKCMVVRVPEVI